MKLLFVIYLQAILLTHFSDAAKSYKKKLPIVEDKVSAKFDNPNYVRDRLKYEITKPEMPALFKEKNRKPFSPAWMDYCDPYHCNDYHRTACGLNRRTMRFKWFQSVCHIILNNECADFRGALKYDVVDTKFCVLYVMYLRSECPSVCEDDTGPVCGKLAGHVTLFRSKCALEKANCGKVEVYDQIDMSVCEKYF